ncbi:MAG: hypothetical protein QM784_23190 [Polyangiaceae bacterium]
MNLVSLSARNLARNRFRSVLTVLGVAVSIVAFLSLRTVISAWTVAAEVAPKDWLVTRNKVTFIMPLPKRYFEKVLQTPGIKASTFANWFGGRDPKREQEFFGTLAVDTNTIFEVYTEMKVPPDQLESWKQDRTGAIVGDAIAQKMGWKVGDRVQSAKWDLLRTTGQPLDLHYPWHLYGHGEVRRSLDVHVSLVLPERSPSAELQRLRWLDRQSRERSEAFGRHRASHRSGLRRQ